MAMYVLIRLCIFSWSSKKVEHSLLHGESNLGNQTWGIWFTSPEMPLLHQQNSHQLLDIVLYLKLLSNPALSLTLTLFSSATYPNSSATYPHPGATYPNRGATYPNHGATYPNPGATYPNPSATYPNLLYDRQNDDGTGCYCQIAKDGSTNHVL